MKQKYNWHSFIVAPILLGLFFFAGLTQVKAVTAYGVTTNQTLVRFDTAAPNAATTVGAITGIQTGEQILGIDFRSAGTQQLYALGSSNRIYTINLTTGAATLVGTLNIPLSGTRFGFDFNPTVDRIRIVSNTRQNLRVNPTDATAIADGTLTFATDDTNKNAVPNIVGAAYTNNVANATTTMLYDIDSNLDVLVLQNPANDGTLKTVGKLGFDVTDQVGFDFDSQTGMAYAALNVSGLTSLFTINLTTGAATSFGFIGQGNVKLIAIQPAGNSVGTGSAALNRLDFDGDGRADYALFLTGTGTYMIRNSGTNTTRQFDFAIAGTDIQTPGDYDGDGKTDIAVYRRTTSQFFVLRSSDTTSSQLTVPFGKRGDEPVARDYDGDGRTDFAVVRRSGGNLTYFIMNSSTGNVTQTQFGLADDVVAPGDYDGDGKFDLAVFRGMPGGNGTFFVRRSSDNKVVAITFGLAEDLVVPGDYDGDGKTDYAVLRPGQPFTWYILRSSDGGVTIVTFGTTPQFSVQNDYDGDGKTDIATYDPRTSQFFVLRSSDNRVLTVNFGTPGRGAYPVANYDTH